MTAIDPPATVARFLSALMLLLFAALPARDEALPDGVSQNLVLAPGDNNPRNSEGDFVHLKDGRILFIYSHFTGGSRDDAADLIGRASSDGGKTWSDRDDPVIEAKSHGVANIMSVSLLRLKDDRIALFYIVKKSETDCRLVMRTSSNEARTWSELTFCTSGSGYVVVTNGRVLQLKSGRIIFPAGWHEEPLPPSGFNRGAAVCFFSDDNGITWCRSKGSVEAPANSHSGIQHPVIVELKNDPNDKPGAGRLMMVMSMHLRPLLRSWSTDGGDTWSAPQATDLVTPVSPASLKRIPSTGDLMLVWNDQSHADPALKNKRTPLTVAISTDEGRTWEHRKNLYADPDGSYCFTAIDFAGERVLLGHCAGERKKGLAKTVITSFDVAWVYR